MDSKPLSTMLGHVSAATTLNIYTHITNLMWSEAAAKLTRRSEKRLHRNRLRSRKRNSQ